MHESAGIGFFHHAVALDLDREIFNGASMNSLPCNAISLLSRIRSILAIALAAIVPLLSGMAAAQTPPAAAITPATSAAAAGEKPRTYALVSAVGDRFTYARLRRQVGSHIIDNFARQEVRVKDNALNFAVLRGLDQALGQSEPDSKRILMAMNATEMDGVKAVDRERVALEKMIAALEPMAQRRDWDRIIVVTPTYVFSEHNGMGSKLNGLGVFVQPQYSGSIEGVDFAGDTDLTNVGESATTAPDGSRNPSKRYIAPFSYLQVVTLDAHTLKVIDKNARYDFQKLFDPKSTALNVENSFDESFLAERILGLVELSAGRSINANYGAKVEVGDIKPVKPAAKGK
jgi:hypothetical protein